MAPGPPAAALNRMGRLVRAHHASAGQSGIRQLRHNPPKGRFNSLITRLKGLGFVLVAIGFVFVAAGAFAYLKVQDGQKSLNAFSAAQNVTLTYNEDGQLVDRGETQGAQAIMTLLKDDWGYPVATNELDPNDPVVNTASEYMYQMATIAYHTLHGTQTVVLPADVTAADGTSTRRAPTSSRSRVATGAPSTAPTRSRLLHVSRPGPEPLMR